MIEPVKIKIDSLEAYYIAREKGFEPLMNSIFFELDINTRVMIQRELFGKFSPKNHGKFYRFVWNNKSHKCQETGVELYHYKAIHISHILTKGAHPEMMYDIRNTNIIIGEIHNIWDHGTIEQKKKLLIWRLNQPIIELLKNEYLKLKAYV